MPVCEAAGATTVMRAQDAQEADWLRQGRRLAFRALEHKGVARMEDVGVPRSRVPEMLVAIEGIAVRNRIGVGTFGHAGDGNLHPTFILDRDEGDAAVVRLDAARAELYEAALALGGTVTGEHGIGAARARLARAAARRGRRRGHARDQARPRPARAAQPRPDAVTTR